MFSLKQSDLDYLAVKAIVGEDFERMNNLIIEMQKGYQEYFKKSQEINRSTIQQLSSFVVHNNTRKNFHTVASGLYELQQCSSQMTVQTHWLFEKISNDLSKLKHTCKEGCTVCDNAKEFMGSFGDKQ